MIIATRPVDFRNYGAIMIIRISTTRTGVIPSRMSLSTPHTERYLDASIASNLSVGGIFPA